MKIANYGRNAIQFGHHFQIVNPTILIQIGNTWLIEPNFQFCKPKFADDFVGIYQYEFDNEGANGRLLVRQQAKDIVSVLRRAYDAKQDVIIQCEQGESRSGTIVMCLVERDLWDVDESSNGCVFSQHVYRLLDVCLDEQFAAELAELLN